MPPPQITACAPQARNCTYNLFTKLHWPGDSEGTFMSSSQAATYPPVYQTRRRLHAVSLIAERQEGKLVNTNFYSLWFDPTGNRIRYIKRHILIQQNEIATSKTQLQQHSIFKAIL